MDSQKERVWEKIFGDPEKDDCFALDGGDIILVVEPNFFDGKIHKKVRVVFVEDAKESTAIR